MPLSSVLGASTLIKPGVVTSSTRPSVPYEGQLIYETDTDRIAAYNGAAWVTQNGLQLLSTTTIGSAVSSVTVSNAFSATYDNYRITITGGAGSTNINLNMRFGSTTTGYYTSIVGVVWGGATNGVQLNNTVGYMGYVGSATTSGINMNFDVCSPFLSKETYGAGQFIAYNAAYYSASKLANTTSYTDFTLTPDTGTLTGGTIRVYGYANS